MGQKFGIKLLLSFHSVWNKIFSNVDNTGTNVYYLFLKIKLNLQFFFYKQFVLQLETTAGYTSTLLLLILCSYFFYSKDIRLSFHI